MNLNLTQPTIRPNRAQMGKVRRAYLKAGVYDPSIALLEQTVGAFQAVGIDPPICSSAALAKEIKANAANLIAQGVSSQAATEDAATVNIQTPRWSVEEKFDFLTKLVGMVIRETTPSAVLLGSGGLGKTYTVRETLDK